MVWSSRKVERENRKHSNTTAARGSMEQLGWYLCSDGAFSNFLISGGVSPSDRLAPIQLALQNAMGAYPVVILHDGDSALEQMVLDTWRSLGLNENEHPLWLTNQSYQDFEPFFGMSDMQVIATLRKLALKLGYTVTPRFERVVRAHLSILRELKIPYSLSGLHYLCSFDDMGEFYGNVLALPCGEDAAQRIWADMGVESDDANNQFDLLRSVIANLAHEALTSGWNSQNTVSVRNCGEALQADATFVLSLSNDYTSLLLPYLGEELKGAGVPYILLIDNVKLADEEFTEFLLSQGDTCRMGIVATNAVELAAGNRERFYRLAAHMDCMVLLKHGSASMVEALSEVLGKYDRTKLEQGHGTNRGFFSILPDGSHRDARLSTENRYRVMPEEITSLGPEQAIVFNMAEDQIIYYN